MYQPAFVTWNFPDDCPDGIIIAPKKFLQSHAVITAVPGGQRLSSGASVRSNMARVGRLPLSGAEKGSPGFHHAFVGHGFNTGCCSNFFRLISYALSFRLGLGVFCCMGITQIIWETLSSLPPHDKDKQIKKNGIYIWRHFR
jgi:hypothetical protein